MEAQTTTTWEKPPWQAAFSVSVGFTVFNVWEETVGGYGSSMKTEVCGFWGSQLNEGFDFLFHAQEKKGGQGAYW